MKNEFLLGAARLVEVDTVCCSHLRSRAAITLRLSEPKTGWSQGTRPGLARFMLKARC
jgi:hypothetical protein